MTTKWVVGGLAAVAGILFLKARSAPRSKRATVNDTIVRNENGEWATVAHPDDTLPPGRLLGQTVVIGNKLWLLSGWNGGMKGLVMRLLIGKPEVMFADVWTLDLSTKRWCNETLNIASDILETTLNVSRFQAAAIGDKIWIHTHRCRDHILCLDTKELTLTKQMLKVQPQTPGANPGGRGLHSMSAVGHTLYILGGAPQDGQMYKDMWAVDTKTLSAVEISQDVIGPIGAHTAATVGSKIYIFGGARRYLQNEKSHALEHFPRLVCFDTDSQTFEFPAVQGQLPSPMPEVALHVQYESQVWNASFHPWMGEAPTPRTGSTMVALSDGKTLCLTMGWLPFKEMYADVWLLDTSAHPLVWRREAVPGQIAPRSGHMAAPLPDGEMIIFGGYAQSDPNASVQLKWSDQGSHERWVPAG